MNQKFLTILSLLILKTIHQKAPLTNQKTEALPSDTTKGSTASKNHYYNIDYLNKLPPNKNCTRRGLTWGTTKNCKYCKFGICQISCRGKPLVNNTQYCNRYNGDTICKNLRPLLCIKKLNLDRPAYEVNSNDPYPSIFQNYEYYNSWSGAFIRKTKPVMGCQIWNKKHADKICEYEFGCGWKMARENDGRYKVGMSLNVFAAGFFALSGLGFSGEQFYGYGNLGHNNHETWEVHVDSNEHQEWNRFWIYPRFFFFGNGLCWNGFQDGFNFQDFKNTTEQSRSAKLEELKKNPKLVEDIKDLDVATK